MTITAPTRTAAPDATATSARVIIVGTGFSGIGMAAQLKRSGMDDFLILERADDVGGTWRDNTYPGCACDVPSLLYSFSWAQNPDWSDTFSPQPEIWEYLRTVAKDEQLDAHTRFGHTVQGARWDETRRVWSIETSEGTYEAQVLIAGLGPLSEPSTPHLPGIESFEGTVFHSATWDHDHDLRGERVAVIGTGASAIQFVPAIQPSVDHLTVFQRTPPWVMERRSRPIGRFERTLFKRVPGAQRLARASIYWARELTVIGFTRRPQILKRAGKLALAHLHQAVEDPELRRKLTPSYAMGCKRILLSNDWYPALTQPNVTLEDAGIAEVKAHSIVTVDGTEHPVDTIIFGTGFQVADIPAAQKMWGTGGVNLGEKWSESASAYLGSTVDQFPNLFFLVGPNTGLGHSSMVFMIESQVSYVMDALRSMDRTGASTVEVRPEAVEAYNVALQEQLGGTVWNTGGCKSWYLDKTGKNTSLWPDFTFVFRKRTRRFDPDHYVVTPAGRAAPTVAD
ncbi:flavin-containing monooxygenase [Aquihabitans sp. McL0605]|uniref:flavin-containing monooxygenase n=1 Tax=Aquihabitans sp. McL0605 TaxID=3415671 RepID=UPI003CEE1935